MDSAEWRYLKDDEPEFCKQIIIYGPDIGVMVGMQSTYKICTNIPCFGNAFDEVIVIDRDRVTQWRHNPEPPND